MTRTIELTVPDLGDFEDVEIIELLVAPGDQVGVDDGILTLETDKAAMDVPSTAAGTIAELRVDVGDRVNQGDVFAVLKAGADATMHTAPADSAAADNDNDNERDVDDDEAYDDDADDPRFAETEVLPDEAVNAIVGAAKARADGRAPDSSDNRSKPARKDSAGAAPAGIPSQFDEAGFSRAHASPSVRKLARELGVNLTEVKGSGRKARITHADVKAWVKARFDGDGRGAGAALPAVPTVDFAKFGEIETRPRTRIQKIAAPRLHASWVNLPHVTQHDLADITELEERRQQLKGPAKEKGISLTPLAFILRAVVIALGEFPSFASSLSDDGQQLLLKRYRHLGFAADTPHGLVVPVIRDADRMDIYEIADELAKLSALAREGKLSAAQIQGAVFTVSSLGSIGGTAFTPIINAPEVAILGVARSSMQAVWDGSEFQPRLMLPLSLSYDHRVIDGAEAVRFTTRLGQLLANVSQLLEAKP